MDKTKLAATALILLGLAGCSSSSSSTPADSTDENTTVDASDDATDSEGSNDTETTPIIGNTEGISAGDPNPGSIPDPVLAELTTINTQELGGHKLYAGQESDGPSNYGYFNVDFDCNGVGSFEGFIKARYAELAFTNASGQMSWELVQNNAYVDIAITDLVEGNFYGENEIDTSNLDGLTGNMIVGQSSIMSLLVTRIVKYKECV